MLKDHEIRDAVNALRDVAVQFHAHQSLRERIAGIVVPLLRGQAGEVDAATPELVPCPRPGCACGGQLIAAGYAATIRAEVDAEAAQRPGRRPRWLGGGPPR